MALRKTKGNMYTWVTHTHSHLGGECPHECTYCYMDNPRFGRHPRYSGEIRVIEKEFSVDYGKGKTIFIENTNDLFAESIHTGYIIEVLMHCLKFPDNIYVFQTKNPCRYADQTIRAYMPENCIYGVTIETNRYTPSKAPPVLERAEWMAQVKGRKFVTVEPVLDFDLMPLVDLIKMCEPEFVNIGADSKGHNLPEPSMGLVMQLVDELKLINIDVREKNNLARLVINKWQML